MTRVHLSAPRKYRNQPQMVDGLKFDSKKEANRYQELKAMERMRFIAALDCEKNLLRYKLFINRVHICDYIPDFRYVQNGLVVVEDVKGVRTAAYRIKKKLMKAIYGIEIREV